MSNSSTGRQCTVEETLRILDEVRQPGVQIAGYYRRCRVATSQFYGWRERARKAPRPS